MHKSFKAIFAVSMLGALGACADKAELGTSEAVVTEVVKSESAGAADNTAAADTAPKQDDTVRNQPGVTQTHDKNGKPRASSGDQFHEDRAIRQALREGKNVEWQNDVTGGKGKITAGKIVQKDGKDCRDFSVTGSNQTRTIETCATPDGKAWVAVDGPNGASVLKPLGKSRTSQVGKPQSSALRRSEDSKPAVGQPEVHPDHQPQTLPPAPVIDEVKLKETEVKGLDVPVSEAVTAAPPHPSSVDTAPAGPKDEPEDAPIPSVQDVDVKSDGNTEATIQQTDKIAD